MVTATQVCPRCGGTMHNWAYEPTCVQCGNADYGPVDRTPAPSRGLSRYPYQGDRVFNRSRVLAVKVTFGRMSVMACPRGSCAEPMKAERLPYTKRDSRFVCSRGHVVRLTTCQGVKGWA